MVTKTLTIAAGLTMYMLEADSRRKSLFIQKTSATGQCTISQGTNPTATLGAVVGRQLMIMLPNQYDWFEANKALGWNTEGVWWIYDYSGVGATIVIDEGLEDSPVTERSKPVSRPM